MVDIQNRVNPELEEVDYCPLCRSAESRFLFWNFDRLYYFVDKYGTVECTGCGLIRLTPRPKIDTIAKHYPETYGAYVNAAAITNISDGDRYGVRNTIRRIVLSSLGYETRIKNWQKVMRPVLSRFFLKQSTYGYGDLFPRFVENGSALEIGCGNGFFLSYLKHHGWNVRGIDLSPHAARCAQEQFGIEVFVGEIQDAPFSKESFDFIRLSHVVEHFFDPVGSIDVVFRLLKPGGTVYIEVPNSHGAGAEISGRFWYGWDAPRHLFMFSPNTICRLIENSGFRITKLRTTLWDSFSWALNYKYEEEHRVRLQDRPFILPGDMALLDIQRSEAHRRFLKDPYSGDIISCWATKRAA